MTTPAAGLVAAGGTLGVLLRAALAQAFPVAPGTWPWTTFAINLVGSLLLGVLLEALRPGTDTARRRAVRLTAGTGVLGGFTTYSTFALEVERLLTGGQVALGAVYGLVGVVSGVAAAVVGVVLVAGLRRGRVRRAGTRGVPGGGA